MSFIEFIKNGRIYKDELNGDNSLHIFDIPSTNIYLEKYDQLIQDKVTYHDIISMTLFKNDDRINRLPNNLRYLYMKSATLTELPISDDVAKTIEVISLDFTNLQIFPDISKCTRLKELTINHSNLTSLRMNYEFPASLKVLNLRFNNIADIDYTLFKSNPNIKINLSYNHLPYETLETLLNINNRIDIKMQGSYKFKNINHTNYDNIAIQNIMNNININDNLNDNFQNQNTPNVLKGNTQTVHLSSINRSILTSYKNILNYITEHKLHFSSNEKIVVKDIMFDFLKITPNEPNNYHKCKSFLNEKLSDCYNYHSILKITYIELLSIIWTVIKSHEQRENLVERLYSEIIDSIGVCFTGCMNRLINVLVGYVEGVNVSISLKEEIQMSIQILMDKFIKQQKHYPCNKDYQNKIYKETKEEMVNILNQKYEVDISDKNNIISDEYKNVWLVALKDYRPNAIFCKFSVNVRINDTNDRLNNYYYISYDNLIYNSEQDFDEENNPYGEIQNADNCLAKIYSYKIDEIEYPEKHLNYILS